MVVNRDMVAQRRRGKYHRDVCRGRESKDKTKMVEISGNFLYKTD